MYSRLSRLIVLFAMLVCLPLNGLAALAMPACEVHGQTMVMHADADQAGAMPGCDHHESESQSGKTPCDKCLSCHMASTQAVIPFTFSMQVITATQKFIAALAQKPQSVTSFLFRPPIPAFA
jgi:hypothetical protein